MDVILRYEESMKVMLVIQCYLKQIFQDSLTLHAASMVLQSAPVDGSQKNTWAMNWSWAVCMMKAQCFTSRPMPRKDKKRTLHSAICFPSSWGKKTLTLYCMVKILRTFNPLELWWPSTATSSGFNVLGLSCILYSKYEFHVWIFCNIAILTSLNITFYNIRYWFINLEVCDAWQKKFMIMYMCIYFT